MFLKAGEQDLLKLDKLLNTTILLFDKNIFNFYEWARSTRNKDLKVCLKCFGSKCSKINKKEFHIKSD